MFYKKRFKEEDSRTPFSFMFSLSTLLVKDQYKKTIIYSFLSLIIIFNQGFQCEERIPNPGVIQLNISVVDENEKQVPNALMGLYDSSPCLVDTFYTNAQGKRFFSFLNNDQFQFFLVLLPSMPENSFEILASGDYEIKMQVKKSKPLISIQLESNELYDSRQVINRRKINQFIHADSIITIPMHALDLCNNNLITVPTFLDKKIIQDPAVDTQFIFQAIPNSPNIINVYNFKNDTLISETAILVNVGNEITNIKIQ